MEILIAGALFVFAVVGLILLDRRGKALRDQRLTHLCSACRREYLGFAENCPHCGADLLPF
jgi:hypothetical protein